MIMGMDENAEVVPGNSISGIKSRRRGIVVWFTGLPASGKSTMASRVGCRLRENGYAVRVLDGDDIRRGLCRDLGYGPDDRKENLRRVAEVCRLFVDCGVTVLASFIAPTRQLRRMLREIIGPDLAFAFCDCPGEICEERDPKGHYARARKGEMPGFTGVSAPYEPPRSPEIHLFTGRDDIEKCVEQILSFIEDR